MKAVVQHVVVQPVRARDKKVAQSPSLPTFNSLDAIENVIIVVHINYFQ